MFDIRARRTGQHESSSSSVRRPMCTRINDNYSNIEFVGLGMSPRVPTSVTDKNRSLSSSYAGLLSRLSANKIPKGRCLILVIVVVLSILSYPRVNHTIKHYIIHVYRRLVAMSRRTVLRTIPRRRRYLFC